MIDPIALVSISVSFFLIAVAPGPATLSNAMVAMSYGRKAGLFYGAGLALGLAFWGLVAASGLGAVLQSSVHVLTFLKCLGGLYLIWLAVSSARSALKSETAPTLAAGSQNWFLRGLILNLSNPKAVVAWMAALAVGLDARAGIQALVVATSICISLGFLVYLLYSVLFSMGGVMRVYQRWRRGLEGIMAGLFTLAGLGLIRSAFSR